MKIAIRMDDITPDMDAGKFNAFIALCESFGVKPLLGIVPNCKDPKLAYNAPDAAFWNRMHELKAQGYTLAQHGCTHEYRTKTAGMFPLNRNSETAGLPYREQYALLAQGRKKLLEQGIDTDIYMAPSHSYDRATLKALKELGFAYVTDGFGRKPYERYGLTFLPISFMQSLSLKQKKGVTTFVVHVSTMKESDFTYYESLFKAHKEQLISYSELLNAPPARRGFFGAGAEWFLAIFKYILVRIR